MINVHSFEIFRTGKKSDVVMKPNFYACLAGGGNDLGWGLGFKKLLENISGGDVLIIRADDRRGGYENWIYSDEDNLKFPKVNSVTTLVLKTRSDGDQKKINDTIKNSEFIFFAGGDQSLYIDYLKNTMAHKLIQEKIDRRELSIAGTSAGMAIMSEFDYAAHYSSPNKPNSIVTSDDVRKNPLGQFVDIQKGFITLPFLENIVTDTHFSERNREGRLLGFIAKSMLMENIYVTGIGADEETALCFDESGIAEVFGKSYVHFYRPQIFPQILNDSSLSFEQVIKTKFKESQKIDLNKLK